MGVTRVGLYEHRDRKRPWSVRWYAGYDPITGRRTRPGESFRLKRDALRFQAQKQAEFDRGAERDRPVDIALEAFCQKYLDRRSPEWAEKTRRNIEHLGTRLQDYFGPGLSLLSITPDMAHTFWSKAVRVRAGYEGQQMSRDARNRLLRDAKTMFKYAVTWGHVAANPFAGLKQVRRHNRKLWMTG